MLEFAITDPINWWSAPFIEWLRGLPVSLTLTESKFFSAVVFASTSLTEFVSANLPNDRAVEEKILAGIPGKLSKKQSENILKVSEQRGWMRAHATCLLRTVSRAEAIASHAEVVENSTEGFDVIYKELGFVPLLEAACKLDNSALGTYVSRLLRDDRIHVPAEILDGCRRWPILLADAVAQGGGLVHPLREFVISALAAQPADSDENRLLCKACCEQDVSVFLAMEKPFAVIDKLDPDYKANTYQKIKMFVTAEISAGRKIEISDPMEFQEILDGSSILDALHTVPVRDAARVGVDTFRTLPFLSDTECSRWLVDLFTRSQFDPLDVKATADIESLLMSRDYPLSANIVRDTAEHYGRGDVTPILSSIRSKYKTFSEGKSHRKQKKVRLPKVLIATALQLERTEVMNYLGGTEYDVDLRADVGDWPTDKPLFQVFVLETGAGNLEAQRAMLRILSRVKPAFAFFVGVAGGIKDSAVGDVVYSTKVHYIEGGKEEGDGTKARPDTEHTSEALVQLAHRVANMAWQPANQMEPLPTARPAVFASSEKVLTSTSSNAANYQRVKTAYNDTQVVDMESFGFLTALRESEIRYRMIIRGVSDEIEGKAESDARGNQPVVAGNAVAFLFTLLRSCPSLLGPKRKKLFGLF
jgi:nucleoside phosphorylase